jgi:hypothetical protein
MLKGSGATGGLTAPDVSSLAPCRLLSRLSLAATSSAVIEEAFLLAKRLEGLKYTNHPHSLIPTSGGGGEEALWPAAFSPNKALNKIRRNSLIMNLL